jgi:hypothetical protein
VFTDPLLRNGFFYCCVHVHFRGNLFTEPLTSNELFRLLSVMSPYFIFNNAVSIPNYVRYDRIIVNNELKWCGRKRSWPNLRYYPSICRKNQKKNTKNLSEVSRCPSPDPNRSRAEISSSHIARSRGSQRSLT